MYRVVKRGCYISRASLSPGFRLPATPDRYGGCSRETYYSAGDQLERARCLPTAFGDRSATQPALARGVAVALFRFRALAEH